MHKYIKIEFANKDISAVDRYEDIYNAVKSIELVVFSRHDIRLQRPSIHGNYVVMEATMPDTEYLPIGKYLRGVADYVLKNNRSFYEKYITRKRLLVYTEIPCLSTTISHDTKSSSEDYDYEFKYRIIYEIMNLLECKDDISKKKLASITRIIEQRQE